MAKPQAFDVLALYESDRVTGSDIILCLERTVGQARVVDPHALAPGKEMKQPGLVSSRLLRATGCDEECSNSASIIAEINLAFGWNSRQPRRAAWSWHRKWKASGRSVTLRVQESRSAMTLWAVEMRRSACAQ